MKTLIFLLSAILVCTAQSPVVLLFKGNSASATSVLPQMENLVLWLKSDSISLANGAAVTNWPDSSGLAHDFTNILNSGPYFSNNMVNGHPSLTFSNGTGILLGNTNFMVGIRTGHVFAVLRARANPGVSGRCAIWKFANAGYIGDTAHPFNDSKLYENFGADISVGQIPITNIALPTAWHTWSVATRTNYMLIRYNGGIVAGMDWMSRPGFTNNMQIGAGGLTALGDCDFAEVIMWNHILADSEIQTVQNYLSTRYNIAQTNVSDVYYPSNYPGLLGWWDASDLASNNGDFVSTWADKSGFGNNWTNRLVTRMPTFQTSVFNGRPALWFNASASNTMIQSGTSLLMTNYFTTIVIHRLTNNTRNIFSRTASPLIQMRYRESGNNGMQMYNGSSGLISASGPQPVGQLQMDVMQRSGGIPATGQGSFWKNLTNEIFNSGSGLGPYNITQLGAIGGLAVADNTTLYSGHIAEICIYTNVLPYDAIVKLYTTYFRPKWGLP